MNDYRIYRRSYVGSFILVILIFLGQNVLSYLNYPQSDPTSGLIFRLHPLTYFLSYHWIYNSIKYKKPVNFSSKVIRDFGIVCLIIFIYSITFGQSSSNAYIIDTFLSGVLVVHFLQYTNQRSNETILNLLKIFFVVNCLIAIIERIFIINLFPLAIEDVFGEFRSTALLGHPLNNTLITCFLTLFLLAIERSSYLKLMYVGLGLLSIFAFGGRSGLIGVIIGLPFIVLCEFRRLRSSIAVKKVTEYFFFIFLVICFSIYFLTYTSFGERITNYSSFDDDSASVRFQVFDLFHHFTFSDFIIGISQKNIDYVMYLEKVDIVENFWIVWLFKYGFIITIVLVVSLFRFLNGVLLSLPRDVRYILILVFVFVASGNNSLVTNTTSVNIIVLSGIIYSKQLEKENRKVFKKCCFQL